MKKPRKDRTVFLATPTKDSAKKILKKIGNNEFEWAFFGKSFSHAIEIEDLLGGFGKKFESGDKLQEIARELRQPYIDYIGKLSIENHSLTWWLSSVSEKNPFISTSFLNICYTKLALDFLEKFKKPYFVLFVEDRALRTTIFKNADCRVELIESKVRQLKERGRKIIWTFLIKGWFIWSTLYKVAISKYSFNKEKILRSKTPLTLIHTWIDGRSFDLKGNFTDSYFGDLFHRLKDRDRKVVIVPSVLGKFSYRKALKLMENSDAEFLPPYCFISIFNVLSAAITTAIKPHRINRFHLFSDLDISDLLKSDFEKDRENIRTASNLLLYDIVRAWNKKDIKIDSLIYTFENHTWEKVFCIAFKEFYPKTTIIGYQHSVLSRMLLNYFYSSNERKIIPLPDKIITNGKYPEKILKESGYPKQTVVCGGAIRYVNLLKEINTHKEDKTRGKTQKWTVLVTTSIDRREASELIWKSTKAYEDTDEYNVIIKCHPVIPFKKVVRALGNFNLPKNFSISQKPVAELLETTHALLYTSSTTCIEALTVGVPAVHVESDFIVDIDPLDFSPNSRKSARSPSDIKKSVDSILSEDKRKLLQMEGVKTVGELFGEINDQVYDLFIK
jgi:hypothetical protein